MTSLNIAVKQVFVESTQETSVAGRANAQVGPDLQGNKVFEADGICLHYDRHGKLTRLDVDQYQGLAGGLKRLGAFFRFRNGDVIDYFASVGNGLFSGRREEGKEPISDLLYIEGERLFFKFDFAFTRGAQSYELSDGVVDIDLRSN